MDHKISRRNLFIIVVMMFVVLFLFMSILVIKDRQNKYDENDYYAAAGRGHTEVSAKVRLLDDVPSQGDYCVYIGPKQNDIYYTVYYWCMYRHYDLLCLDTPSDYTEYEITNEPVMIMLDGKNIDAGDTDGMHALADQSAPVVYCSIPNAYNLQKNPEYMRILGITGVPETRCEVYGIHLFGGFVLGGDRVYTAQGEDEKLMDMDTVMVRYKLDSNTKTYMVGAFEETPTDTTLQPPLIWRYSPKNGNTFVFNCDLMSDLSGMGYLSACLAESSPYDLYSVVNADVLSLLNFPCMAEEDTEEIIDTYNRSMQGMFRNLIWPAVISVNEESEFILSAFMAMQYNYYDQNEADKDNMVYYMMQLKEQRSEAGLSLYPVKPVSVPDKLSSDAGFLEDSDLKYKFQMAYLNPEDISGALDEIREHKIYSDLRTILTDHEKGKGLFNYEKDMLVLRNTADILSFKYSDDLKLRGFETALLYSGAALDVSRSIYPEEESDEWQHVEESFAAVVGTFWKNFKYVDKLTASQADTRVREFLAVDYSVEELDDGIKIYLDDFGSESYLIFRSVNNVIEEVEGGEFDEIEDGVYLIKADNPSVVITFEESRKVSIK